MEDAAPLPSFTGTRRFLFLRDMRQRFETGSVLRARIVCWTFLRTNRISTRRKNSMKETQQPESGISWPNDTAECSTTFAEGEGSGQGPD